MVSKLITLDFKVGLLSVYKVDYLGFLGWLVECLLGWLQGWEFAHLISEWIARLLSKNERMSDSHKKMSDSLICSFLVSEMSDSLTLLISSEQPEQIAHF